MMFDIIITTLNRPDFIVSLVNEINSCDSPLPINIIVIDASAMDNIKVQKLDRVKYIKSSHKNQPYQRYLGYLLSEEPIILFLDDDIKILDKKLFQYIISRINDPGIAGATMKFIGDGENAIDIATDTNNRIKVKEHKILQVLWSITGAPRVKKNGIWLAGLVGPTDDKIEYIEAFAGPGGMAFRREIVPNLFDDLLFSLYEIGLGKGEDKYISMAAIKYGKLAFIGNTCLLHPSHPSNYFKDLTSFSQREIFSRFVLSKRYAETINIAFWKVKIHFYYYAFWRILISLLTCTINPQKHNIQKLKGKFIGVFYIIKKRLNAYSLCPNLSWQAELDSDIRQIKYMHKI
jgi:glycosyltransferase involved in cell wall biosynthesis